MGVDELMGGPLWGGRTIRMVRTWGWTDYSGGSKNRHRTLERYRIGVDGLFFGSMSEVNELLMKLRGGKF